MKEKPCINIQCKKMFLPTSNRQRLCPACKKEAKTHKIEPLPKILSRQSRSSINIAEDITDEPYGAGIEGPSGVAEDIDKHSDPPKLYPSDARMTVNLKFKIGDRVIIIDIDQPAKVVKIILDGNNFYFECCYWWEGQLKFVNLDETEIRLIHDKLGQGNTLDHVVNGKELKRWKV